MNRDSETAPTGRQRGFWSLFVTQFQGAFSDNSYRTLAMFLIIAMPVSNFSGDTRELRMALVGALFALPFILFSMAGGFLADRFSKRSITIGVKVFEVFIMLLATAGLVWQHAPILFAGVFLMGTHSAFFGPSKYGLLPELLPEKKLSWGNGLLELGTFLAIVLGTIGGGWLFESFSGSRIGAGVILLGLAVVGLVTSFGIDRVPAADPVKQWRVNLLADLWMQMRTIRRDRVLALAVLGNTYFFFLAALIQQYTIYAYGKDLLALSEGQITSYLMPAIALGIGAGSFAAGYLSGNKIEYGLIPLGSLGMTIFGAFLALPERSLPGAVVGLVLYGFFAGFFIVPIATLIQHRPDRKEKGAVIAASNLLSFVGIFAAAAAYYLLGGVLHLTARQIFLATTVVTFGGTVYALWLMPDAFLRFILWIATHTVYRVRVLGRDNIPEKGGALFVCNHVSYVDALFLIASTDRRVRFMMFAGYYDLPYVKPFARMLGVIPISSEQRPREMLKSLEAASQAIRDGEVVCIFAEGQVTRIGQLLPFRRGIERIMQKVDAPIVPVALDGVWGSIFSFEQRRFIWKWPRRIPYPVTVSFGLPMSPGATASDVREAVQDLLASAWPQRRRHMQPLPRAFVHSARRHPFRVAMADSQSPKVRFGSALVRTILLARRLRKAWVGQTKVGLLFPPSVPAALVNFAAMLTGKVPVNLNYTGSADMLSSCIRQCGIKSVVTSKAFLDKVKLQVPCELILLEETAANPLLGEKLVAILMAWMLPVGRLERALGRGKRVEMDDLATVIFSSGSTGEPKGVMLSHYNISSNIEQMEQVFSLDRRDRFLGILPFFHSFGFTGTLCLPAVLGVGVVYHANPLDAKTIGPLVCDFKVTFVLATPTFLQLYVRGCAPEEFGSVRAIMTAAEKLPERLVMACEEHFGIRPLEGYGCTECSPVVALNSPDFRSAGFRQVGAKRGKIGHPLPGLCVRIVDAESHDPVPLGQSGLLLVRGPNVMQGYLGLPDKTAEVLRDGWYSTGDIAALDEDGFLQITDRLSRFSKIGGEMVPHIRIEEKLHELAGATEQSFVVTGVPDEKKGERLVVLHKLMEAAWKELSQKLPELNLPNLWKPRLDEFFHVDALPLLGTGKLDLRKIRELAAQFSNAAAAA